MGEDEQELEPLERQRARARAAARARIEHQQTWVDVQVRQAMERGDFDNLAGAGKPLDLGGDSHDRDWWVKRMLEREQVSGVAPEAILLRTDDAQLDRRLDRLGSERAVRDAVATFNARIVEARRQLLGGPPVVTKTRDPEEEVRRWRERRQARRAQQSRPPAEKPLPRRRWPRLRWRSRD